MVERGYKHVPEDWQRAIAIVAHPDDLEYGASSAVAKWTRAGKQVSYVLVSRGEAGIDGMHPDQAASVREAEQRESSRLVGVDSVEFLGYQDGVIEYGLPLRRDLARAIRQHRPEAIIASSFDMVWPDGGLNQADHRAVGLAACDAAADAANRWIFPELIAEGLEPWRGTRWLFICAAPSATHACDVGEALHDGIASLKAHRTYFEHLGGDFDPETFLRKYAAETGARLACEYAIDFRVVQL